MSNPVVLITVTRDEPGFVRGDEQIPGLAERSKLRVKNFFADFDARLGEAAFVAGQRFSVADITALVTVDFAAKAINFPVPDVHRSLKRWYDAISSRPSMAAW